MLSAVAIFGAVLLLQYAQLLRAFLAKPFRLTTARLMPPGAGAPAPLADLYLALEPELAALGFGEPLWILNTYEGLATGRPVKVYRHRAGNSLVWLAPPADLRAPNLLLTRFTTRLADGRTLTSQVYDVYFEITATPEAPGHTLISPALAQQWAQHQRWCAGFAAAADPASLETPDILAEAGERYNAQIGRLLQAGKLWRGRDGIARARPRFALDMLLRFKRSPAPQAGPGPVPAARLALMAQIIEQVRNTPTPPRVQWAFFAGSIALFLLLGGLLWSFQFAAILFGVVAFHESGHYLAMRAFGYRNVQMLLLPLVGGVTIGFESNPSAAQSAWMSLMGPLPGIVLGWVLFVAATLLELGDGWLHQLAVTMLAVNYLNILPVPPLDGGRVVQALLPARWIGAQAGFVGLAGVFGVIAALSSGLPALAVLAGLSLLGLPALWQNRRVVRSLLADGVPPPSQPRVLRIRHALEAFERHALPMKKPQARILQAEAALRAVDTSAMRWRQRLVLGLVYGFLLAVPVAGAAVYMFMVVGAVAGDTRLSQQVGSYSDTLARAGAQAAGMDIASMVRGLRSAAGETPAPASEQDLAAAESRLGARLPPDLRAIYLASDGLPEMNLAPLREIRRTDPALIHTLLAAGKLQAVQPEGKPVPLQPTLAQLSNTLRLGPAAKADPDQAAGIDNLLDLNQPPLLPGHVLLETTGGVSLVMAADPRKKLEELWTQQQALAAIKAGNQQRVAQQRAALQHETMPQLVGRIPSPGLRQRLLLRMPSLPPPVDAAALAAAARRLPQPLPEDLRALLALHDGLPPLNLLGVEHYAPLQAENLDELREYAGQGGLVELNLPDAVPGPGKARLKLEALQGCTVVGVAGAGSASEDLTEPVLLWCPQLASTGLAVVDAARREAYPDFTALLREHLARQLAIGDSPF